MNLLGEVKSALARSTSGYANEKFLISRSETGSTFTSSRRFWPLCVSSTKWTLGSELKQNKLATSNGESHPGFFIAQAKF